MSLRIAFHQTPALRTKTGIGHYTAELLGAFAELGADVSPLPSGLTAEVYRRVYPRLTPQPKPGSAGAGRPSALRGIVRGASQRIQDGLYWHLSRQLTAKRFDLYHEPNLPLLSTDVPTVFSLYDLSLALMPQHHPADRVAKFEAQMPRALEQASHIITISHAIREEIIQVLGWPPERVTCTYLGVRPSLKPLPESTTRASLRALGLPERYLLYVGTLEPRKNLLTLMRAYCRLPDAVRGACPLLLVGGWGWNVREMADYLDSHARHRGVVHLGYVPEEHLCALYNGARALVYPSLYEGFGLPPLEMMACGGPVLASTAAALKEIFGGHAELIDPDDEDGWTDAMARVIVDDDWRRRLCDGVLVHSGRFTWRRCAEETLAVYRRVVPEATARRAA